MDFEQDLIRIATEGLSQYGMRVENAASGDELLHCWVNVQLKLIPPMPRKVELSPRIPSSLDAIRCSADREVARQSLDTICKRARAGDDLNPYLSRSVVKEDYTDAMFADWGVYHLHLNEIAEGEYFAARADYWLFAIFPGGRALLIDIRRHDTTEFLQRDLLEIINSTWPEVLVGHRLVAITGQTGDTASSETIRMFREAGINAVQTIGSHVYAPPGGGLTTRRTSMRVRIETDRLLVAARRATAWATNCATEIRADIKKNGVEPPQVLDLRLVLHEGHFLILERTTGWACPLFGA